MLIHWKKGQVMLKICDKICHHHEKAHISRYESLRLYCCDPFKLRKKIFSKALRKTDSELVAILKIKPGQKLCRNLLKKLQKSQNIVPRKLRFMLILIRNIQLFKYKQVNIK